jgi:plastocyanin
VSRTPSRTLLAVATAVTLVMAFSGEADASHPSGATHIRGMATTTISGVGSAYGSSHWTPARVRIDRGSRVKWIAASYDHVLAAYGDNWTYSRPLAQGQSVTRRFGHAGIFRFRCTVHSTLVDGQCQGMCGKIIAH